MLCHGAAVCHSELQCVAVCCNMLQYVAGRSHEGKDYIVLKDTVLFVHKKRVAACCSVL